MLMAHPELSASGPLPGEGGASQLDVLGLLDSLGEENSTAERCFRSHSRSSVLQGLPFGGVPTVLAINVVIWMVRTHPTSQYAHSAVPLATFTMTKLPS